MFISLFDPTLCVHSCIHPFLSLFLLLLLLLLSTSEPSTHSVHRRYVILASSALIYFPPYEVFSFLFVLLLSSSFSLYLSIYVSIYLDSGFWIFILFISSSPLPPFFFPQRPSNSLVRVVDRSQVASVGILTEDDFISPNTLPSSSSSSSSQPSVFTTSTSDSSSSASSASLTGSNNAHLTGVRLALRPPINRVYRFLFQTDAERDIWFDFCLLFLF